MQLVSASRKNAGPFIPNSPVSIPAALWDPLHTSLNWMCSHDMSLFQISRIDGEDPTGCSWSGKFRTRQGASGL